MTTISINPSKSSTFEFDVSVQGVAQDNPPSVRFIIEDVFEGCDVSINCSKVRGSKWAVDLPSDLKLTEDSYKFRLEVVVNEYYFEPAEGTIEIVKEPDVQFTEDVKPVVTTSFGSVEVLEEQDAPVELLEEPETVEESVEDAPPVEIIPAIDELQIPVKKRKSLFNRDEDGRPLVKGVDTLEVIMQRQRKAEKLKEILAKKS